MQLADNLTPLTHLHTHTHIHRLQHICGSDTNRHPAEDKVTLKPSDQDSHWATLGFFPGTGSRGISLAKCLWGVVTLLKDGN